ncbi:hypothetical protein [Amycolatopsis speibonae]|uniref:Uncharacterized protein n=1 Tax=Amycolatopsis speibonae TaxID=1450224 RepID=A0ABV7P7C9_9PSEU
MSDDTNDKTIAALLRERAALQQQGKTDRIEQVDAELKARGHETPKDEKSADAAKSSEDPKRQAPQGRSANRQQTTEQKNS